MAVARRLGLQLDSIGLPGHFLLALRATNETLYIDAFHQGAILDVQQCRAIVASYGRFTWSDAYLQPLPPPDVWQRMRRNLVTCCERVGDERTGARLQLLESDTRDPLLPLRAALSYAEHCRVWPVDTKAVLRSPARELPVPPVDNLTLQ